MPSDPVSTKNPTASRADFTYSIMPTTLVITDTGQGTKSVVEDLPAVLRRIEYWHQGSGAHLKLTVLDSAGREINNSLCFLEVAPEPFGQPVFFDFACRQGPENNDALHVVGLQSPVFQVAKS